MNLWNQQNEYEFLWSTVRFAQSSRQETITISNIFPICTPMVGWTNTLYILSAIKQKGWKTWNENNWIAEQVRQTTQ